MSDPKYERIPGTTLLPAARVKRIVKEDRDIQTIGSDAVFLISIATEYWLQKLITASHQYAAHERRKTVMYKDVGRPAGAN